MKLVIFDLDQTLVDFIPTHDEVTRNLFRRYFGVDARLTETDFTGRSLTENFSQLARLKNIPEDKVKENMQRLLDEYDRSFIENFPTNPSAHILPSAEKPTPRPRCRAAASGQWQSPHPAVLLKYWAWLRRKPRLIHLPGQSANQ